ncbi:efflux RND transporter periplasmic adaptor subunit [Massilia sp. CF038]|uniref:efflux RND transporter periplasmic adaptor subunit n=1 Tax=Massilia sp. CF038 TaxID=1881045 RepID=UPI00091D06B9|nr:HlyD family efflux transporter periplasmic adaptor subunit [Massilia sp. CF038]SHG57411.1 HlyD family secretion protein [Massilia sp. CF038]
MDTNISPLTHARRRRTRLIITAAVLAAIASSAWALNHVLRPSIKAADVRISTVRQGGIANAINAAGVVIPMHEEMVSSPIQSRVAKVHAKPGQRVAAGEVLLELDGHTIQLALDSLREQLAQQENRIAGLTLELDQKRKQIASSIELLELDLQSARVKKERYTTLRKAGGVSGEDMLTAELNVSRVEIQLRQQKELIEDSRRSTNTSIEGARLQKSILQKQIEQQQNVLARTRVSAPFAGTVTMLLEDEGASVQMGQLVARVSEPDNYKVEATLSDFHARALSPGQAVRVEQDKDVLSGRVQTILPEIQNGTVKLLVSLDQPHHPNLRNKMRVDVSIITGEKPRALIADTGPGINGKGRQAVWVVRDGVARKTELEIGAGDGKVVEIVSGASLGAQLIVSDSKSFKEHDTIRISN